MPGSDVLSREICYVIEGDQLEKLKLLINGLNKLEILRKAVFYNSPKIIKWCVEELQIDLTNTNILESARFALNRETITYLIEHGADIRSENDILSLACYGDIEFVKYLVGKGADINYGFQETKYVFWNPIINAATAGNLDIVKYLVEKGANIHIDNDTAFNQACYHKHLDVAKYLIEHGVNIDKLTSNTRSKISDEFYYQLLHFAMNKTK